MRQLRALSVVLAISVFLGASARAAEPPIAALLPGDLAAYLTIAEPAKLVDIVANPDPALWARIQETEGARKYYASKDYAKLKQAIGMFEGAMGAKWPEALRDLAGRSIHVGVVPQAGKEPGLVVVLQGRDPAMYQKLINAVSSILAAQALGRGQLADIEKSEANGVERWVFAGKVHAARSDELLIVSNVAELIDGVCERRGGEAKDSLAQSEAYQQSRAAAGAATAWACLDLNLARKLPNVAEKLDAPTDNPLLEMLVGSLRDALIRAPRVTASLTLADSGARFSVALPQTKDGPEEKRQWCLPKIAAGEPGGVRLPGQMGSLVFERDFAGMWAARQELFDERANEGFIKADSNLSLFLSGRELSTEILPGLGPRWQLVVAPRTLASDDPRPALKLPAGAIVVQVRDQALMPYLLLAFQDLIGVTNVNQAQNGRSQLLLSARTHRGAEVHATRRIPATEVDLSAAPIEYNLEPACALYADHFILGSTREVVESVIDALAGTGESRQPPINSELKIEAAPVHAALLENRDLLVSQTMLRQGGERQQAAKEVDALLSVAERIQNAGARIHQQDGQLRLDLFVDWTAGKK